MNKLKQILKSERFRELVLYGIAGVLTTIVNYAVYFAVTRIGALLAGIPADEITQQTLLVQVGNILGWFLSVCFAYYVNRRFVFHSNGSFKKEIPAFLTARLLSLGFDALFMLANSLLFGMNDLVAKLISNVIVVILNYFASKLWIFKKTDR